MIVVDSLIFHNVRVGRLAPRKWCHITSDTSEEELHLFVEKIGMKREWFQKAGTWAYHYDLVESKRKLAIKIGAKEVSNKDLYRIMISRRRN